MGSRIRLLFLTLIFSSFSVPASAQEVPKSDPVLEAKKMFQQWRKDHLLQEAASLEARILNTRLLRLRADKEAAKKKEVLERAHKRARKAYQAMQGARSRAAAAFTKAGQAIEAGLKVKPKHLDLHCWRAELFATIASSGRSIGSVLGPKPRGLMSFQFFRRGLESATLAHNAKKDDALRIYLKARLLGVFNRYKEGIDLLKPMVDKGLGLQRDRLLLASYHYYLNNFDAALKLLAKVNDKDSSQPEAVELKRVLLHSKKMWTREMAILAKGKNRPTVELTLKTGKIVIELYEDEAPNTVANFIHLVETKFYDKTKFHRVLSSFVAQSGDPNTRSGIGVAGTGGPGWTIADEFNKNSHTHFRGSLAMASGKTKNSAGSQFYFCLIPVPYMDGRSTVFGRITKGLELLGQIRAGHEIVTAKVLNKRDHPYTPKKNKGP
ncbi:MAG: peptidylprolyl isomerase [Planctomycetota bacterium]|nr:peptidylprolyl isomerase [Planctomycetota bacterium]